MEGEREDEAIRRNAAHFVCGTRGLRRLYSGLHRRKGVLAERASGRNAEPRTDAAGSGAGTRSGIRTARQGAIRSRGGIRASRESRENQDSRVRTVQQGRGRYQSRIRMSRQPARFSPERLPSLPNIIRN